MVNKSEQKEQKHEIPEPEKITIADLIKWKDEVIKEYMKKKNKK